MDALGVLVEGIGRASEVFEQVVDGLSLDQLNERPGGSHNSITWLAWHAARQQDAQVAALAGVDEVWLREGWVDKFDLDLPRDSMGYGHTSDEVAKVQVDDASLLIDYLKATETATIAYLRTLDEADLDEVIDTSWTPAVTRGVRLVSIIDDAAQHAGQAAYAEGLFA